MKPRLEQTIRDISVWLLEEIENPPTTDRILERFKLTEYELKLGFAHVYGTTVGRWYRQERIRIAAALLQKTDETIALVAESVGYRNPSKFAEAFRTEFGCGPSGYRLRFRE